MAETIAQAISAMSKERRDAWQAEAAAGIAKRNDALHAPKPAEGAAAAAVATGTAATTTATTTPDPAAAAAGAETKAGPVMKATGIVNEEHGVIMLVGSLADAIDCDNDTVPADFLINCAHDFCGAQGRQFKANHNEKIDAKLVESVLGVPILKSGRRLLKGEHIPKNDPMVSVGLITAPGEATAWVAGVKPADPAIVAEAKAGRVAGASWAGHAERSKT